MDFFDQALEADGSLGNSFLQLIKDKGGISQFSEDLEGTDDAWKELQFKESGVKYTNVEDIPYTFIEDNEAEQCLSLRVEYYCYVVQRARDGFTAQ